MRPNEWEQLCAVYPGADLGGGADGTSLVTLPDLPIPPGWSVPKTTVWFVVPAGYPASQPDCFWASPELRLAGGALPANSGAQTLPVLQIPALWFSWHLAAWRPSHDNVTTYTRFISRRFDDAR